MAAALLIAAGFAPLAHAEGQVDMSTLDISTLTCRQLATMTPEQVGLILVWIEGYLGGRADDSVFVMERVKINAEEAARACDETPARSVLDIIEKFEARQVEQESE